MNTPINSTSTSSASVVHGYEAAASSGLRPHDSPTDAAQVLHVSSNSANRSLDQIERDFVNCLCDKAGESA
jgi:mevalonate pyrophosphate decarboxylase